VIFKRGKQGGDRGGGTHVMRGRDSAAKTRRSAPSGDGNPLARRFHPDDEPDTVDLLRSGESAGAAVAGVEEAATRDLAGPGDGPTAAAAGEPFMCFAAKTGKFYLLPGSEESPVLLNGATVAAATELRSGDRIELGGAAFLFQPAHSE
jgi:hypothetical protein